MVSRDYSKNLARGMFVVGEGLFISSEVTSTIDDLQAESVSVDPSTKRQRCILSFSTSKEDSYFLRLFAKYTAAIPPPTIIILIAQPLIEKVISLSYFSSTINYFKKVTFPTKLSLS